MPESLEIRRKRLKFRSAHRGIKELDLLLVITSYSIHYTKLYDIIAFFMIAGILLANGVTVLVLLPLYR